MSHPLSFTQQTVSGGFEQRLCRCAVHCAASCCRCCTPCLRSDDLRRIRQRTSLV